MTETPKAHSTVPVVATDHGRVRIGHPFGPAPRGAALAVHAGMLVVDPFTPDGVPYTELSYYDGDDDRFGWLADVYGEDVAGTVHDAVGRLGRAETQVVDTAAWDPGPVQAPVARLAVARWLHAWSPEPLHRELLDAEIGHLSLVCTDVLRDADQAAETHFQPAAPLLRRLVRSAFSQHPTGSAEDVAARTVRSVLRSAVEVLGAGALPELTDRIEALWESLDSDLELGDDPVPLDVPVPVRARPTLAVSSVDWVQVRAGLVDERPDSVYWTVTDNDGGRRIDISVGAGRRASAESDPPWARVYIDEHPLPVAVGPLRWIDAHGQPARWSGRLQIASRRPVTPSVVDVYSPSLRRGARTGTERERARLEREAVNQLVLIRARCDDRARVTRLTPRVRSLAAELASLPGHPDTLVARLQGLADAVEDGRVASASWRLTLAEQVRRRNVLGPFYRPPG